MGVVKCRIIATLSDGGVVDSGEVIIGEDALEGSSADSLEEFAEQFRYMLANWSTAEFLTIEGKEGLTHSMRTESIARVGGYARLWDLTD